MKSLFMLPFQIVMAICLVICLYIQTESWDEVSKTIKAFNWFAERITSINGRKWLEKVMAEE